jgi:hypothetical protein
MTVMRNTNLALGSIAIDLNIYVHIRAMKKVDKITEHYGGILSSYWALLYKSQSHRITNTGPRRRKYVH